MSTQIKTNVLMKTLLIMYKHLSLTYFFNCIDSLFLDISDITAETLLNYN